MDAWVKSAASDYVGQPISLVAEALPAPLDADMGLLFESEMKRYGISSAFAAPIEPKDQPLVVQYEVTLTGGLTCGGAYIRCSRARRAARRLTARASTGRRRT